MRLKRYMDDVKPDEKDQLDSLISMFFYGCNIPFQVADSIYFKKMVKALRPAYEPPSRRQLAGKLLDQAHETIEKRNKELVKQMDNRMTLLVDGWQNSSANRHYETMMLATSNDQKIFLDSNDFSGTRETGENLTKAVDEAIKLAKDRYDATVYAGLTDNAYNMQSMGNELKAKGLLYSTCNAHSGNLLAGDILKKTPNSNLMSKVMIVQNEFKRPHLESMLSAAGGKKPELFSPTRWTSQRNALESCLKNLSAMKEVTAKCDKAAETDSKAITVKPSVSSLLYDQKFITSAKTLLEMLNPVAELTNFFQKSTASAADAAEKWLELLLNGPIELREFLEYRIKKSNIFNEVTMTAHFFHPIYRGTKLSAEQKSQFSKYIIEKLENEELESLKEFQKGEGKFAILARKNFKSPKTYWHYAAELGHGKLSAFAMDYLKIPASTALLERLFSNWGFVHSDMRNRLSEDTSKKLINIYFTLRSTDEITDEDMHDIEFTDEPIDL